MSLQWTGGPASPAGGGAVEEGGGAEEGRGEVGMYTCTKWWPQVVCCYTKLTAKL